MTHVRFTLTANRLSALLRRHTPGRGAPHPSDRISAHVERAQFDTIRHLIDSWAEVQTEALMREILAGGMPWAVFRLERPVPA